MYFGPRLTSSDLPSQANKNQYCLDAQAVRNLRSTFSIFNRYSLALSEIDNPVKEMYFK